MRDFTCIVAAAVVDDDEVLLAGVRPLGAQLRVGPRAVPPAADSAPLHQHGVLVGDLVDQPVQEQHLGVALDEDGHLIHGPLPPPPAAR